MTTVARTPDSVNALGAAPTALSHGAAGRPATTLPPAAAPTPAAWTAEDEYLDWLAGLREDYLALCDTALEHRIGCS